MRGVKSNYQFFLTLYTVRGSPLLHTPVSVDWQPAWHWTSFDGQRRGVFGDEAPEGEVRVEPVWHARAGEPYAGGFRMTIGCDGAEERAVTCSFPFEYFKPLALSAASHCVAKGWLKENENFLYEVSAFPFELEHCGHRQEEAEGLSRRLFAVERVRRPLALRRGAMTELVSGSVWVGPATTEELPSVFIPQHVLDEATDLARAADGKETGGVLIGHLVRDTSSEVADIFVEVTAQVHARSALGEAQQLTFTPEAWEAVQTALDLRGRGEKWVGWWHSHPREVTKDCGGATLAFMSAKDCKIHRGYFARAYNVALVVTEDPDSGEFSHALFGWWRGLIVERGFYALGASREGQAQGAPASQRGDCGNVK